MGKLVLVGLPLGNPKDITERALRALETGKHFACEDTRNFISLMHHYKIDTSEKHFHSFHDNSKDGKAQMLLRLLKKTDVYLVSDAGSPVISDPAYPLIKLCMEDGIEIDTYPGPSSLVASLELSGLPSNPVHFFGFYPRDKSKQKELNELMQSISGTIVLFESPKRIEKTLNLLCEILPDASYVVTREMTKTFQSVYRFNASDWLDGNVYIETRGEMVLLIYQSSPKRASQGNLQNLAEQILEKGPRPKLVSKIIAEILDLKAKDVYTKIQINDVED